MILHYCNPPQRLMNDSPGTIGSALFVLWLAKGEAALASCCGSGFGCAAAVCCNSTLGASFLAN